ncbi:palmitoyl-(protein) hydrolase [Aureococcus anophagefferens]|nr:palmitoyl-(protein) hydrolase [Aureococcus anophagefferens]
MARDERFVGAALLGPGDEAACVVAEYAGFESDFGAGAAAQKLAHGIWEKTMKRARQAVSADAKASRVLGDAVGRELQRLGHGGAALDDGDASAGPWCGGCGVELGAGPPNWVRVCGGRGCGALVCEGCCDQGGFFRKAAEAKARCQGCRGRAAARREILDGWASADSRRVALTRLGRAFASVDAAGAGRVGRHLFGKLLLRSRDKWGDGDGDDDDPALGDAFAAADRDGDGFVDLQDVVEWLSSAAQSQEKKNDRATLALAKRRSDDSAPPRPAAADVPVVLFDEVGDDGDFEDVFEEAGAAPSTFGAIASALGALAGAKPPRSPGAQDASGRVQKHRRRSVRFSDADEVEVSRGFAFDRVVKQDGSVKWELGPLSFEIPSLRDAQKKLACVRSDFTVVNDDGLKLACSLWSRVLDADDFDDRATWRRPGKASTEQRPKAFEKPCVLYLHGNASCRLECLPHVAPLLMLGLRVCAVDTSGSGLSEGEFVTLGEREAKDAACVAAHLVAAKRASVVALYGRSMGGVAAILGGAQGRVRRAARRRRLRRRRLALRVAGGPRGPARAERGLRRARDRAARGSSGGRKPIDDAFIRDVRGGARDAPRAKAAGFFAGLSARGALAESAAKAAIDAVTGGGEEARRADVASADASLAVAALDAPLLLVAANGDQLIPPRPNAGALLVVREREDGPKKSQRQRDAELLLVKGGHNSRRPHSCARKTYEFLAKHLSAPGTDDAELEAAAAKLDAYRPKIAGGHAPWTYCAQALKAPTKDRGGEFRSGMTDAREKAIARDISSSAAEAPLPPPPPAPPPFLLTTMDPHSAKT